MRQFSALDGNSQAQIIAPGVEFTTYWALIEDEQEAVWLNLWGGNFAVGDVHQREVRHAPNALALYDPDTLARYCISVAEVADPPPAVPAFVSGMQLQQALDAAGMLDQVEAAVAAAPRRVQIYWAKTSDFHRDHPELAALADGIGKTPAEIDAVFIAAAAIT